MINYRKILELAFNGTTQRTIEVAVASSRNTIREVVNRAKKKNLTVLDENMTNQWLENYLFPEKMPVSKGYYLEDWEYVHKELGKCLWQYRNTEDCNTEVHSLAIKKGLVSLPIIL